MAQTPFTGWILVGYRSQSRSAQHAKPEALERFAPGSRQLTRVGGACIGRLGSPGAGDDSASQDFFFYCRARAWVAANGTVIVAKGGVGWKADW